MKNKYIPQIQQLQSMQSKESPLVSLFVPIAHTYDGPTADYRRLTAQANKLLTAAGQPRLELEMPDWKQWQKQGTRTLAIYHRHGFTTLIPLVIEVPARVVVAESFHVKPLVASAHSHLEGLHLHFHYQGCTLFRLTPTETHIVESFLPTGDVPDAQWPASLERGDVIDFISYVRDEVKQARNPSVQWLSISGAEHDLLRVPDFWKKTNLKVLFLEDSTSALTPHRSFESLHKMIQTQTEANFRQVVRRIERLAAGKPETNLRSIGAMILERQVQQICVSLEDTQFGELGADGQAKLYSGQRGVQDDDVLDDLVELALRNGVSVRVVPRKFLPLGQLLIAA